MVELFAFRRSLIVALALCSAAIVASVTPVSARSHHHGAARYAQAHHAGHRDHRHHRYIGRASRAPGFADPQASFVPTVPGDTASYGALGSSNAVSEPRRSRHMVRGSRWQRGVAQMQARGLADTQASAAPNAAPVAQTASANTAPSSFGSSGVVAEARRYLGGNPTGRGRLWCARFMNLVLEHSGYHGTGSDMARSFANYGQRVSGPQIGAIAVMGRGRGGGHVGIITGIDASGNPIMISGNNGNRVREAPISRGRIYAYVMPAS